MASRAILLAARVLPLILCGCQGPIDTVAAYQEQFYDPQNPPQVLSIQGDITPVTDPTMFRWHDTYWVFSSGPGISVHSSTDGLETLLTRTQVFAQNPPWIGVDVPKATDLWSPDVLAWNGIIHLYYAASSFSSTRACIGHATATSIEQGFVDDGAPVICSNVTGTADYTAIDPAVVLDASGSPWMVFGSWGSGIQLIALDSEGKYRDTGIYSVAARSPNNPAIQAAYLYRWQGYYYLFVSFDSSPNHSLRVGRAKDVQGPYLDRDGTDMAQGGGTLVLAGDDQFSGPGSNMVFDDGDRRLNVYHAYDANQNGVAVLRIGPLLFDTDGWPHSAGP